MPRSVLILALVCTAVAAACGGSGPTGPTPQPARISRTRFLAFGDSITLGEVTTPVTGLPPREIGGAPILPLVVVPAASYPSQLHARLMAQYPSQAASITVVNSGVGGEHAHEGAARFGDAFDAAQPQVVLLMEGANDLRMYGTDLPTLALYVMTFHSQSRGAKVFVASMLPSRPGRLSQDPSQLEEMNAKLKVMVDGDGKGATLVNLYDPMKADAQTLIGSDGLHPTEAGYRRIAELFFAAIRSELESR